MQTVAVHRVSVEPGNPDYPTTGIADGHRHRVLAANVKAGTPNLAALSEETVGQASCLN